MSFGGSIAADSTVPEDDTLDNEQALVACSWLAWEALYTRFRIVVEVKPMQNHPYVRISTQIYNERAEYEALAEAVLQVRAQIPQLAQVQQQ